MRNKMNRLAYFMLLFSLSFTRANPTCPELKKGAINIHFICHTHDDVGWLKTVDQYYYGARKEITWVGVQYILDSVVKSLEEDPRRKFIYVESAFFFMWWHEQNAHTKQLVKKFVENGQLEFIGGGWSMNDEAAAHYNAIIDQMSLGLVKLNKTFGKSATPRIAWQIDPFGHSKEQASLFAQMGMDGLFLGRIDHADKSERWRRKEMEMIWKASEDIGKESWLFTGILPHNYSPPKGFCFDLLCADDPIMDDPRLEENNVEEKVNLFLKVVEEQLTGYATSNLIMTMGEDFDYVGANSWYKNLEKLMKLMNGRELNGTKLNLVYSTPSCYLDALHKEKKNWPVKTDDFFPYSSDPHAYWTGYFTSRPSFKGYVRKANNILQILKQLSALSGSGWTEGQEKLAESMGIAQHHDAITGTAKQPVSDDYTKRLAAGIAGAYSNMNEGLKSFTKTQLPSGYEFCPSLNISACPFTETSNSAFVVTVYNPLAHPRGHYVRLPVSHSLGYKVQDSKGRAVEAQLVPIPASVYEIPGRSSSANFELVFYAEALPALGYEQFLVQPTKNAVVAEEQRSLSLPVNKDHDTVVKKGKLRITLDKESNFLKTVGLTANPTQQIQVTQDWFWYAGMRGNNTRAEYRASGAYIFRPNGTEQFTPKAKITAIYDGNLVAEVHQEWVSWITQVIRLYKHNNYLETEWLVGPIPTGDEVGKEIVTRYTLHEMATNKTFYTDSNGRQMLKRIKDYRQTWILNSSEPISQNYYPVTSRMILKSTNGGDAALLNDRAQGGTSMEDGQMELMVHRRLLDDDAFGVGEPLNETAYGKGLVVRGHHYFLHSALGNKKCDFACQHRALAQSLLLKPILAFSPASDNNWNLDAISKRSFLTAPLPPNIYLLTLEPWQGLESDAAASGEKWLLRLEHYFEANESSQFSTDVSVDIKNMFADWKVLSIAETNLAANQWKKEQTRLEWEPPSLVKRHSSHESSGVAGEMFKFSPMQIRTFILTLDPK